MTEEKIFYQYKILVELKEQISFDGLGKASLSPREYKNSLIVKVFDEINNNDGFIEYESNNRLISIKKEYKYNSEIIAFKLAKKRSLNITKKEQDFIDDITNDYPNSLVILDTRAQTFYVEKNYKLFKTPSEMNKILMDLLEFIKKDFEEYCDASFRINIIIDTQGFKECFYSFDVVNKISLIMNSPNSFLGNQKADEFLNKLREETNTEETKIEIANNSTGINYDGFNSQFGAFYEYIVNGGGEWAIQGKANNKKSTKKSSTRGKTITLNVKADNLVINANNIINILEKENRYEEDEN